MRLANSNTASGRHGQYLWRLIKSSSLGGGSCSLCPMLGTVLVHNGILWGYYKAGEHLLFFSCGIC